MKPKILIQTPLGKIELELYATQAPVTVANFLRYVDEGRFKGATFYRAVRLDNQAQSAIKIEVIQGGLGMEPHPAKLPPITQETTAQTGVKHLDGTISMARLEPNSAHSEFFICVGNQPELDFGGGRNPDGQGFAAFGRVTQGMETVRAIQAVATGGGAPPIQGQLILEPIPIEAVLRLR